MKVSVVITTYNAAQYIIETLESVVSQTYKDLEIIIVDDGSTDNTLKKKINDYMLSTQFKEINIYPIAHIGRSAALNYAVSVAKNNWIAILDADDLWHERKLELQVNYMQTFSLKFICTKAIIFSNSEAIDLQRCLDNTSVKRNHLKQINLNQLLVTNLISHSTVMANKEWLNYSINRARQIDYELWLRLSCENKPLYILDFPLAFHRIHSRQSFEANKPLLYSWSATRLQLQYCLAAVQFRPMILVLIKFGYYLLLPRRLRLLLRNLIID